MGFFDAKVICVLCDKEVGLNRNKTKHGWICSICISNLNNNNVHLWDIKKYSIDELKNKSGNVEYTINKEDSNLELTCVVCDKEVGLNRNKTKHGWVCDTCTKKLSNNNVYIWDIKKYSIDELKSIMEQIKNEDKIEERQSSWERSSYSEATRQPNLYQKSTKKYRLECPRCKGNNIDLISNIKNKKIVHKTSININPLQPLTVFNTKTTEKKKKSKSKIALGIMTGGASLIATGVSNNKNSEYFCRECGHKWIGK